MNVFTSPEAPKIAWNDSVIFLAGSIEQGVARDWQKEVIEALHSHPDQEVLAVLNPRRASWDPTWNNEGGSNPKLVEQINWELDGIDRAELTFFFLQSGTISPISLLELGKVCEQGQPAIVVCEPGFHRRTNVLVTASRAHIHVYSTLESGILKLLETRF